MTQKNGIRQIKQKAATLLLTLTFVLSGTAAFADQAPSPADAVTPAVNQPAGAPLFSDVASGYWAEKHIYKLASEGIILGDNGKFRPNDSVTQQEAITIAIRFMSIQDPQSEAVQIPKELQTSSDEFNKNLGIAIAQKLIDPTEEIAATDAKEVWGKKKASREWIAKVIVRALGKEAEAKAAAGKGTTFADNSTISAVDRGYVNVAVDLNLTQGVEGNRFDPQGSVSRAQIATFFSRGQAYLTNTYSSNFEGIATSIGNGKISLYIGGQNRSFILDNRTVYFTKDSEKRVAQSDVQAYSKVLVIDKVGTAAYIEITDPQPQVESIEGTLLRVLTGSKLVMLVNNEAQTYQYDASTSFVDQNGSTIKPENMANDSTIVLKRETFTADKKPVMVQVKSGMVNKTSSGTVQSVDLASKTVTVKEASGNEDKLVLTGSVKILYQGQVMDIADLKVGSIVNYTIKENSVISVEVTQSVERSVNGTLVSLGGGKLLTYKKSDGTYATLQMADKPQVVVNGIASASLDDLIADENGGGDQLELTLDAKGTVTKIQVLNRQSEQLSEVSVVQYDKTRKLLTIIDSSNNPYVLQLDDKTKVDYNSPNPVLTGLESLLNAERRVTLTHIGKRVLSISVIYQYEGNFVSVDTAKKKLKLQTSNGKTVELSYTNTSLPVYMFGKSNAILSDVKVGDPITAMLDNSQNTVEGISVKTAKQFEIVSVDTSAARLSVKADGLTQSFYTDKAVLLNDTGATIKVTDLKVGSIINVAFNGSTATSVQTVKLSYGKVTNVDETQVTYKSSTGTVATISSGTTVKVIRGTAVSTSLSSLTTTDHISVRKDADGTTLITVLTPLSRTYWRYDAINKDVYVKKESLSDTNNRFNLQADTYIHQSDNTLTVQSLQENDNIVLYFDGDKLVEIEKQ